LGGIRVQEGNHSKKKEKNNNNDVIKDMIEENSS